MDESTMTNKASAPDPWGRNVLVEFEDGIAWVSMNRPEKKNAINVELAKEMAAVVDALAANRTIGPTGQQSGEEVVELVKMNQVLAISI